MGTENKKIPRSSPARSDSRAAAETGARGGAKMNRNGGRRRYTGLEGLLLLAFAFMALTALSLFAFLPKDSVINMRALAASASSQWSEWFQTLSLRGEPVRPSPVAQRPRAAIFPPPEPPGHHQSRREFMASILPAAEMPVDATASSEELGEFACMALTIYFEARGEPRDGQIAVGDVVLNRKRAAAYPDDVCEVVLHGGAIRRHACQFSFICDGSSDRPREERAWEHAKRLAWDMLYDGGGGSLPADALYYHADYVSPPWARSMYQVAQVGRHIFYSGDRRL